MILLKALYLEFFCQLVVVVHTVRHHQFIYYYYYYCACSRCLSSVCALSTSFCHPFLARASICIYKKSED